MCGICGFLRKTHRKRGEISEADRRTIKAMSDRIIHRGPNAMGSYVGTDMALGFRRLTIIDLSDEANQPLYSNDGRFALVFNGEIYNYKSLRRELEALGADFVSDTDSEVIVHGFSIWGAAVFTKLRGMFAFAIWDLETEDLYLVRDPFGIKPLYYSLNTSDGSLVFASEIKAFLPYPEFKRELDSDALMPFLNFQYSAGEKTFFKNTYKLLPGHYLHISRCQLAEREQTRDAALETELYFQPTFDQRADYSEAELVADLRERLEESVRLHLQSDVPLGAFLSGGVDSSYIVALSQPQHTFSVGFEGYEGGGFNEVDYARRLSNQLGIEHHHRDLSAEDCFNILPTLQYHMDEPHGNFSAVPLYFLAKLARERVTVVLSGEGADELFAGYDPYRDSAYARMFKALPGGLRRMGKGLSKCMPSAHLRRALERAASSPRDYFIGQMKIYSEMAARDLLNPEYQSGPSAFELLAARYDDYEGFDELDQKQLIDLEYWMPGDILLKADKMSSAHSLELRVPFLDLEVWENARRARSKQRVRGLETKHILREAASQYLPEEWFKRQKYGFMVPLSDWLRDPRFQAPIRELFNSELAGKFFQRSRLIEYLDAHASGAGRYQHEIYLPYIFLIWYQEYFLKR
ncbi:MAG: asparagine synthase (glutamine-hydrolyzing) [Eubacteriales bacterium]|nr:asparagine synthase (glutamine-hydrolyzing) [Eubacteriales bacterium]